MNILIFPSGPFQTNTYVAYCKATRKAVVIDPAPGSFPYVEKYIKDNQLSPDKILLTHSHWDHIADVSKTKKKFNLPVYVHELDAENLKDPGSDGLPCWIPIEGVNPDFLLKEDQIIEVGNLKFQVICTPGHTPGGVCFFEPSQKILFSGDTLFQGTIGNLSFPTARPNLMWQSLQKLAKLPPETKAYPGHGPSTTIKEEPWLDRAEKLFGN